MNHSPTYRAVVYRDLARRACRDIRVAMEAVADMPRLCPPMADRYVPNGHRYNSPPGSGDWQWLTTLGALRNDR